MQPKLKFHLREYRATAIADALWIVADALFAVLVVALIYGILTPQR